MTTTIQKTSKPLKALLLVSNLIQGFGLLGFIGAIASNGSVDPLPSLVVVGFGMGLHVFGKALVWWTHG